MLTRDMLRFWRSSTCGPDQQVSTSAAMVVRHPDTDLRLLAAASPTRIAYEFRLYRQTPSPSGLRSANRQP